MNLNRMIHCVALTFIRSAQKRGDYLRNHHLLGYVGQNVYYQGHKLPLHPKLIYIHDNVKIASNVGFVTHDIIHRMLNEKFGEGRYTEKVGCIEVMDNVFIGSGTRILYDTRIGSNVIIGSGSLVNKDIPDNSVYAGVPARYICSFDEYVAKAKKYSDDFSLNYGVTKLSGVDSELAQKIHNEFLKSRNAEDEKKI